MPSTLFATAFQTPGRRAFGRVCELPEGFAWAKKEMGGKIVAAGVVMNFTEEVRAPVFLMATTKLSGKAVTSLMLVVAFVYPEDNPGIVVSLGFHGLTHDWMQKFYGKMLAPATLRRESARALARGDRDGRVARGGQPLALRARRRGRALGRASRSRPRREGPELAPYTSCPPPRRLVPQDQ